MTNAEMLLMVANQAVRLAALPTARAGDMRVGLPWLSVAN